MVRSCIPAPLVEVPVRAASFPDHIFEANLHPIRVVIFCGLGYIDRCCLSEHQRFDEGFPCEFSLNFGCIDDGIVGREGIRSKDDGTEEVDIRMR